MSTFPSFTAKAFTVKAATAKTATSVSGRRFFPVLAITLAATAWVIGCDSDLECPSDLTKTNQTAVECQANGGVQVASSTLALPATAVPGSGATTCMQADSTCGGDAVIAFKSPGNPSDGFVQFGLRIAPGDAPRTYPLVGDSRQLESALVSNGLSYTGNLVVTAGTLVLTRNQASGLDATFDAHLQTTDGQHQVSLTGGALHIGPCQVVTRPACVSD